MKQRREAKAQAATLATAGMSGPLVDSAIRELGRRGRLQLLLEPHPRLLALDAEEAWWFEYNCTL